MVLDGAAGGAHALVGDALRLADLLHHRSVDGTPDGRPEVVADQLVLAVVEPVVLRPADEAALGVAALGGISLLTGGVGIFTIMTIAVRERTQEIGLLRAIGARHESIGDARGVGLMGALEFTAPGRPDVPAPELAAKVLEACLRRGLLLYMAGAHGQVVRLMPPLVLTPADVDRALAIVEEAVTEVEAAT